MRLNFLALSIIQAGLAHPPKISIALIFKNFFLENNEITKVITWKFFSAVLKIFILPEN